MSGVGLSCPALQTSVRDPRGTFPVSGHALGINYYNYNYYASCWWQQWHCPCSWWFPAPCPHLHAGTETQPSPSFPHREASERSFSDPSVGKTAAQTPFPSVNHL